MAKKRKRQKQGLMKKTFRGFNIKELTEMGGDKLLQLYRARVRRKFERTNGYKGKYLKFLNKVVRSKQNVPQGEKPKQVNTHFRNFVVVPQMVGAIVGVYNG